MIKYNYTRVIVMIKAENELKSILNELLKNEGKIYYDNQNGISSWKLKK